MKTSFLLSPLDNKPQGFYCIISGFLKKYIVAIIAMFAAAVTCVFVPFDKQYASYFDLATLSCLFCTLAVVGAFKNIRFFTWLAKIIVCKFKTARNIVLALVFVTYIGSMLMANDMALITFLPLGFVAMTSCGQKKYLAFTFIMQNIAANLGGMLTPFGNPQNLYLFSYFDMNTLDFLKTMVLPFVVALVMIVSVCFCIKPEPVQLQSEKEKTPPFWRVAVYSVIFIISVLIVFKIIPYYIALAVVVVSLLILDPKCFLKVDFGLLITFAAFFVFSGNLSRIDAVRGVLSELLNFSPLLVGVLSCQVISNVPTAVLLSHFTTDVGSLLVAVNIGGLGTPIASLASLITLNEFRKVEPTQTKKYLLLFSALNFAFLAVLFVVALLKL